MAAEETKDGQARAFACSLAAGHDGRHVCTDDLRVEHRVVNDEYGKRQ